MHWGLKEWRDFRVHRRERPGTQGIWDFEEAGRTRQGQVLRPKSTSPVSLPGCLLHSVSASESSSPCLDCDWDLCQVPSCPVLTVALSTLASRSYLSLHTCGPDPETTACVLLSSVAGASLPAPGVSGKQPSSERSGQGSVAAQSCLGQWPQPELVLFCLPPSLPPSLCQVVVSHLPPSWGKPRSSCTPPRKLLLNHQPSFPLSFLSVSSLKQSWFKMECVCAGLQSSLLGRLRQEDHVMPGFQGQPRQHNKTLTLQ